MTNTLRGWAEVFGFPKDPRSYGEYVKKRSPDGRSILIFEPGIEYAMGRSAHQFRLIDPHKDLLQTFKGLETAVQIAWWSPDSRILAIPISGPKEALLLYDVKKQRYALIRFSAYQETAALRPTGARTSVDPVQFAAVFGQEFRPPRDSFYPFSALRWFPAPADKWKLTEAWRFAAKAPWLPPPSKELRKYARENGIRIRA